MYYKIYVNRIKNNKPVCKFFSLLPDVEFKKIMFHILYAQKLKKYYKENNTLKCM